MNNVFDITTYGAYNDGNKDCTKAIQTAIDDAAKVKGAVIVPPGKYMCGCIKLQPSVSLIGYHGWGYREQGGSTLMMNDENAPCLIDMTGAFGSCVKGIQLSGNKLLGNNIHGIMVNWHKYNGGSFESGCADENPLVESTHIDFREDNFVIADCQCKNFSGDGIHLNRIFAFTVCDCQLMSNKGDGIFVNGWDGWIHDCIIHTNKGAGIGSNTRKEFSEVCCTSITITGNRIEWNHGGGISINKGNSLNINNNFFDRSGGAAIKLEGMHKGDIGDITIVGNLFRRSGKQNDKPFKTEYEASHLYMEHCSNVAVSANVCRYGQDDGLTGKFSPQYSFVLKNSSDCVVLGNAMKNGFLKENIISDNNTNVIIANNIE